MARVSIKTQLVFNKLPELRGQVRRRAADAVTKAAFDVEAQAKALAPVDTGALKSSIQAQPEGDLAARVDVGAEYGIYVEFGTRKMRAQPFLEPAAEQVKPSFEAAMRQVAG